MTYKHIEASREIRLWITRVILPIGMVGLWVGTDPEKMNWLRYHMHNGKEGLKNIGRKIKSIF